MPVRDEPVQRPCRPWLPAHEYYAELFHPGAILAFPWAFRQRLLRWTTPSHRSTSPNNTKSPISPRLGWAPGELRHCGVSLLADSVAANDFQHSQPQNLDIQSKAPMIYVPQVQLELPLPGEAVAAVDLGPPRHARLH